ncbi:16074_t:CDS:2 [Acaulospora colombiana]|uniref:16074_t:CDS:1 n=1 Tax=Acaulospora colombiana TaxID=27376 RepID=A0ACA9KD80_9GLOM|nr:16074_t:CDS:2 [Acaulospora colombiana]
MLAVSAAEALRHVASSSQSDRDLQHRTPSPNPSANFSDFLSETNDEWNDRSDDEDLSVSKRKIQNQPMGLQTKDKEKEKVPELAIAQPEIVEKSAVGIKAEIAGLVQGQINLFGGRLIVTNLLIEFEFVLSIDPMNLISSMKPPGAFDSRQSEAERIHIDVPRTNPGTALYQYETTQQCLERILYVWAIRHPASGYVQGINDLVTPFFQVFLSAYIDEDPEVYDPGNLPKEALNVIEADSFWSLSKLLDGIQVRMGLGSKLYLKNVLT